MMRAPNYKRIQLNDLEYTCVGISPNKWESLMGGAVRANKAEIDRLVKRDLPSLYHDLCLNYYNPYNYFRTARHLILVHSRIEHFITYSNG
jgi:hypothetical protein